MTLKIAITPRFRDLTLFTSGIEDMSRMTKLDRIRKPIMLKPSASLTEAQIKNQTINFSLKNPYKFI